MSTTKAAPLTTDRSQILDVLRSFALLGICAANYAVFSMFVFQSAPHRASLPTAGIDHWLGYFHFALISGKFYSLFSLLFGIGFSIILLRNQKEGRNPLPLFYRRLFFLLVIGLAHALFLWDGDILVLYALLGMLLPFFRNLPDRALIILWIALIFSPLLFDAVKVITEGKWNLSNLLRPKAISMDAKIGITEKNFSDWLLVNNEYKDVLNWNQSGFFWRWEMLLGSNRLPKVLGMFLLGLYVGRNLIYARLEENRSLFKKVQKWALIIGLPTSIAFAYFEFDGKHLPSMLGLVDTLFYALSVVPMSLFYASTICLLWLKPVWQKRLALLAPAGRMALTNYLVQTFVGIFIFYGIGLGFGTKWGPSYFIPVSIALYILQVYYSWIWFMYFKYGPVEWIWRQLTYGKFLKLRKEPAKFGEPR